MVPKTETASSRFSVQTSLLASIDERSEVTSASETQSFTTALSRSPEIIVSTSQDYVRLSTATVSRTTQKFLSSSAVNGSISQKGTFKIRLNRIIPTTSYQKTLFVFSNNLFYIKTNDWWHWRNYHCFFRKVLITFWKLSWRLTFETSASGSSLCCQFTIYQFRWYRITGFTEFVEFFW